MDRATWSPSPQRRLPFFPPPPSSWAWLGCYWVACNPRTLPRVTRRARTADKSRRGGRWSAGAGAPTDGDGRLRLRLRARARASRSDRLVASRRVRPPSGCLAAAAFLGAAGCRTGASSTAMSLRLALCGRGDHVIARPRRPRRACWMPCLQQERPHVRIREPGGGHHVRSWDGRSWSRAREN